MGTIPDTKVGKIDFCENHVTPFTDNAVAIGTESATVTAWAAKVVAARDAYTAQQAAQSAAKDATGALNMAIDAMMVATNAIYNQVRAKAAIAGDGVYTLASLPIPGSRAPVGPPGKPAELKVALDESGSLTLKWKCPNPAGASGTLYQIWRRNSPTDQFEYIGGAGEKKFIDSDIPAGSSELTYRIQAVRSTAIGEVATFNVNFGTSSSGTMTASVSDGASPKLAA
jgi:hypothetical protein